MRSRGGNKVNLAISNSQSFVMHFCCRIEILSGILLGNLVNRFITHVQSSVYLYLWLEISLEKLLTPTWTEDIPSFHCTRRY